MSRYTFTSKHNRRHEVSFGHDHALGYFYDVYDNENEKMLEEKCDRFNGLTGLQLLDAVTHHASEVTIMRYANQFSQMKMDCPF